MVLASKQHRHRISSTFAELTSRNAAKRSPKFDRRPGCLKLLALVAFVVGCTREAGTWHAKAVALDEVQSFIPESSGYILDGGTMVLSVKTDSNEECLIVLKQHTIESAPDAGRLFFNGKKIEVRSKDEMRIVDLLKAALLERTESPDIPQTDKSPINTVIIDEETDEAITSSTQDTLHQFCERIITFVESDEYLRIANHSVSADSKDSK